MKPTVLILCTGNSARSQMAEGFLRHLAGDRFEIFSAGLTPKGVDPYAIEVMREVGIDISSHESEDVRDYLGRPVGVLITVCDNAERNCPTFPAVGIRLHWPFDDPAAFEGDAMERLSRFRRVRDQIKAKIVDWLDSAPTNRR